MRTCSALAPALGLAGATLASFASSPTEACRAAPGPGWPFVVTLELGHSATLTVR